MVEETVGSQKDVLTGTLCTLLRTDGIHTRDPLAVR